jgi:hypothetical protein
LRFLPFFDVVVAGDWERMLNSSQFAWIGNLTFGVMGGKSGKKRQGDVAVLGKGIAIWE